MPGSTRTGFNSSQLVRLLEGLGVGEVADPSQTFAESLSAWLDWTDAISLAGALNGGAVADRSERRLGRGSGSRSVIDECRRVRIDLCGSIATDAVFAGNAPDRQVSAASGTVAEGAAAFAPFRSRYRAHQQAMETRIVPLRAKVRAALSAHSPALGRLAALDAVFDEALGPRERQLLATVPGRLEQHFRRLHRATADTAASLVPGRAVPHEQPQGMGETVQQVLMAELDIRWKPIEGMIEAMGDAPSGQT
jgi:hypothetical protein